MSPCFFCTGSGQSWVKRQVLMDIKMIQMYPNVCCCSSGNSHSTILVASCTLPEILRHYAGASGWCLAFRHLTKLNSAEHPATHHDRATLLHKSSLRLDEIAMGRVFGRTFLFWQRGRQHRVWHGHNSLGYRNRKGPLDGLNRCPRYSRRSCKRIVRSSPDGLSQLEFWVDRD